MAKKIEFVLDIDKKPIDVAIDSSLNLKQAFRELNKELARTKEGTPEFEVLSRKIGDVKDQMDKTNAKSRDLFSSLSLLPGPVGAFAGQVDSAISTLKTFSSFSFKDLKFQLGETLGDFKDIASSIGKATGITKIYTVLNNALASSFVKVGVGEAAAATGARAFAAALTATGIGAIVVALGLAVSALMEWASGSEEAEKATKELNDELERQQFLFDASASAAKRANALIIAQMKARGASEKEIRDEQLKQSYNAYSAAYDAEVEARKLYNANLGKADVEGLKKLEDNLNKRTQATKDAYNNYLVQGYENAATDLKIQQDNQNKKLQKQKEYQDKVKQDTKTADETLLNLQRENAVLALEDERKRQDKELENQKQAEIDKINVLLISQKRKQEIIDQINQKYAAKQSDVDKKRKEDDLKAEEDFNRKVAEIRIAAIKNDTERAIADRENKLQNDLKDLEKDKQFIKKSEEEKAQIRKDIITASENEIAKIKLEAKLRDEAIEKGDYDAKFQRLVTGNQFNLDEQRRLLEEKKLNDDKYYKEQLSNENLTTEQIRELNTKKLADQIAYTEQSNQIERSRVAVRQQALDDIISIFGAETDVGRAALIAKQILAARELVLEAKKTLTFSAQAAARSQVALAEGTAQTAKVGFPQNIPLLIAYAAQAVGIITAIISAVKSAKKATTETGGEPSTSDFGKNYAEGGMIKGPRHAQGGTIIEAEGGEAIMTRGAVTMFAPLLSMMNQAGGGTSFNKDMLTTANDAPLTTNPSQQQSPMIMKTYVVSNELTTEAEKQARLKDLSTL